MKNGDGTTDAASKYAYFLVLTVLRLYWLTALFGPYKHCDFRVRYTYTTTLTFMSHSVKEEEEQEEAEVGVPTLLFEVCFVFQIIVLKHHVTMQEEPVHPMILGDNGSISVCPDSGKCELLSGPLVVMESFAGAR